jgi:hypothetical protein
MALSVRDGLPQPRTTSWEAVADSALGSASDPTRQGHALTWFGLGILAARGQTSLPRHPRPWSDPFDRAEERSRPAHPEEVLGDFLADQVWSLAWLRYGSFDRGRAAIAALAIVASAVTRLLVREGVRPDRAAAEAVLVVELGSAHAEWRSALGSAW